MQLIFISVHARKREQVLDERSNQWINEMRDREREKYQLIGNSEAYFQINKHYNVFRHCAVRVAYTTRQS